MKATWFHQIKKKNWIMKDQEILNSFLRTAVFFCFQGWNNATDAKSSLETVLSVPNTVHFSDLGYFEVAIMRPSGYNRGKT